MRTVLFFAVLSTMAHSQDLPPVRLMGSTFAGGTSGLMATEVYESRIVADESGNRFTIQNVVEAVSIQTFGQVGYLRKIAAGNSLVWAARFEGKRLSGLALAPSGNVWVAGSDGGLPPAGFVAQVDGSGKVTRSTTIEGAPTGLAVDASGAVYITGTVNSNFRATQNAWKREIGALRCSSRDGMYYACPEAFVMKLSPDASRVEYATFIGGTRAETAYDIAVGADGSAYIVGETTSDDFPTTAGAAQSQTGGVVTFGPMQYGDGFLVRLSPDGSRALYSTYLGGPAADRLHAVALEPNGSALAAGGTDPDDPTVMPGSLRDALLARFDPSGRLLVQARYGVSDQAWYGASAAIADGRVFISILGEGVIEFEADTLRPLRRATPRVSGAAAIAATASGTVDVLTASRNLNSNIFAVEPGRSPLGSQYVARYDFDQPARAAVTAIVNAASYVQGRRFGGPISLAPGEIITVFGEKFEQPVTVTLGHQPLEILYTGDRQINAIVPYDTPLGEAPIAVESNGTTLGPWRAEIAPVVPGLFTVTSEVPYGTIRTAAAVNQDGTVNSWAHPAKAGSIVALYATGLGALTTDAPLRLLQQHLEAYGPGGPGGGMEILYAGEAPGLPGVQQVNVRIGPRPGSNTPVFSFIRLVFDLSTAHGEYTQDNIAIFVQ